MKLSLEASELQPGSGRGNLSSRLVFTGERWKALNVLCSRSSVALPVHGVHRLFQCRGEIEGKEAAKPAKQQGMSTMAEVMALAGALWFICFGAALGGRYGVIGFLLGGVAGAVLGLLSGYAFGLFGEYLIMWLDRLAEKRRVLGTVVRLIVFIVMVYLLGLFFVWSSRIVFQSLKERIRRQRTDTALIALVTMRSRSGTDRGWKFGGESFGYCFGAFFRRHGKDAT